MVDVTGEMVRDIYRGLFGRDPESEDVVQMQLASGQDLEAMLKSAITCAEFRSRHFQRREDDLMRAGINAGDEALLRRHLRPPVSDPQFVGSFVGTRQRTTLAIGLRPLGGLVVHDIPTVANDVAFGPAEYVGAIKAVEASRGSFVMAELGAGLGSWCTIGGHIARTLGRDPIRLYAVEASAERVENLKINFSDNGFAPAEHTIIAGVVGASDGYALFPQIDVQADFGASAVFVESEEQRPGFDTVKSISLESLLANETTVDLLHFDIQGAEADVIEASLEAMNDKVRYMVVGTHGRELEYRIRKTLGTCGWVLENECAALFIREGNSCHLLDDGTQVWRNLRKQ